jgi:hypothetical protein
MLPLASRAGAKPGYVPATAIFGGEAAAHPKKESIRTRFVEARPSQHQSRTSTVLATASQVLEAV